MPNEPILVVDDNALNLKLARLLLSMEGYQVRTAETAAAAVTVLETFHPRMILMDVQLPGIDGLELTQWLRADRSFDDVIILAVTAFAMAADEQRAKEAGCDGFVSKPVNKLELLKRVENLLALRHVTDELERLRRYIDSMESDGPTGKRRH